MSTNETTWVDIENQVFIHLLNSAYSVTRRPPGFDLDAVVINVKDSVTFGQFPIVEESALTCYVKNAWIPDQREYVCLQGKGDQCIATSPCYIWISADVVADFAASLLKKDRIVGKLLSKNSDRAFSSNFKIPTIEFLKSSLSLSS